MGFHTSKPESVADVKSESVAHVKSESVLGV